MNRHLPWLFVLLSASLMGACVDYHNHPYAKMREQRKYVAEIESKAASAGAATFRRADLSKEIPSSLPEVYKASAIVLKNYNQPQDCLPELTVNQGQISYLDNEIIVSKMKRIDTQAIVVTVFMEAKGPDATMVYYYPHVELYNKLAPEFQQIIKDNMKYRGNRFLYRLETQLTGKANWSWLNR